MRAVRFILRFVGTWLVAAGFVALIVDGTYSIAGGALDVTAFGRILDGVWAGASDALHDGAPAWLWDSFLGWVLQSPGFIVFSILGAVLILVGRVPRRHRLERPEYA